MDNPTNTTQIIIFITAFATLVTAIVALLTIREMRKQRSVNYKPELISRNFNVIGKINLVDLISSSSSWSNEDESKLEDGKMPIDDIKVKCFNVGYGVAQNVTFEWAFDIPKIIEKIVELDYDLVDQLTYENDIMEIKAIKYNYRATHFLKRQFTSKEEFIIPSNIDKEPYLLRLPRSILSLLTIAYAISLSSEDKREYFPDDVFNAQLKIICYDIEMSKHEKVIHFHYKPVMLKKNDDDNWTIKSYFEVNYV